jgi:hypothetical protein
MHDPAERAKAVGTAMIVAPGGGFRVLAMSYDSSRYDPATRIAPALCNEVQRHFGRVGEPE